MQIKLSDETLDYTMARPLGSNCQWERVIYSEGPCAEDGTMGAPDMFKLEHSGWKRHVEFKKRLDGNEKTHADQTD